MFPKKYFEFENLIFFKHTRVPRQFSTLFVCPTRNQTTDNYSNSISSKKTEAPTRNFYSFFPTRFFTWNHLLSIGYETSCNTYSYCIDVNALSFAVGLIPRLLNGDNLKSSAATTPSSSTSASRVKKEETRVFNDVK